MPVKYIFQSKRLGFRNWNSLDVKKYAALSSDPEVMRFFPKKFWLDEKSARVSVESFQSHYKKNGYCFFAIEELESNCFIGFIGLQNISYDVFFAPATEIGWRLDSVFWGRGYATEGAKRCLDWYFENFSNTRVVSITPEVNERSENVMRKIGMNKITSFKHPLLEKNSPLLTHVLYEINK